ncbi:MAG: TetR/AcrR family transcriptional regulator [Bacteroidota bacterium]
MSKTKERILEASLALFNYQGLKTTTLQIIANDVQISVGNLAYHYKNKQEIIAAHSEELTESLQDVLGHYRNYPNFLDFHIQLEQIAAVLERFKYIFTNLGEMELVYPDTFSIIKMFHEKLATQIESRIEYHIDKGTMISLDGETISLLSSNVAMAILMNQAQHLLSPQHLYKDVWFMIRPYFTENGLREWDMLISPTLIQ